MSDSTELGGIGTLYGGGTCFVGSGSIDIILGFDHMGTLRQHAEEVACGIIARCDISTRMITTQRLNGLHTSRTLINHLHKIVIAIGSDGKADADTVSDRELIIDS